MSEQTPIVAALVRVVRRVGSNTSGAAIDVILSGLVEEIGWRGATLWVVKEAGLEQGWSHGEAARPGQSEAQWPLRVAGEHFGVLATRGPSSRDQLAVTGMLAGRCAHILADTRRSETQRSLLEGLGHELRTPLQSLVGYADLLAGGSLGDLSESQAEAAEAIGRTAARILAVSRDVLQAARIDAGREQLQVGEVDLAEPLRHDCDAARPLATAKSLGLANECPAGLTIETDQSKVSRILTNLLSNAIKYTERGEIVARGGLLPDGAFVEVEDTGIGIPADQQRAVFDEYVRIAGSQAEGTGLGLPIANRLARLLGGSLQLESTEGKGTRIRLVLPACRSW